HIIHHLLYLLVITSFPPSYCSTFLFFFLFNHTSTTDIYTLSLHDALPISSYLENCLMISNNSSMAGSPSPDLMAWLNYWIKISRSEEHTSELQSRFDLVCRLLLEKKKKNSIKQKKQLNRNKNKETNVY